MIKKKMKLSKAKELECKIFEIYTALKKNRPNDCLLQENFFRLWFYQRYTRDDLIRTLDTLIENQYIKKSGESYYLTQKVFDDEIIHLPTSKELEETFMTIFHDSGSAAGDCLTIDSIKKSWEGSGLYAEELEQTLKSLISKKYIAMKETNLIRLTEKGFKAM
jgi:hypothetical protein